MFKKLTARIKKSKERGVALLMTLIALSILVVVGTSFALMVQSEVRSVNSNVLDQKALYVAESGIQDVLYQRSKMADAMCFPYYFVDSTLTHAQRLDKIQALTGAKPGGFDTAPKGTGTCDPNVDNIPATVSVDSMPCWPYNERLYANITHFVASGPNDGFVCHDGSFNGINSDGTSCANYQPLLYWPADKTGLAPGWKDMDENVTAPLQDVKDSSGARFTTGFFTLCNDDFKGIQAGSPGWDMACLAAKGGGSCPQTVFRLSVVSIGEVQSGNKLVRKAVKIDMQPAALFSGVIDKYVDMTLMYQTNINGSVHINGWWNGNKWNAFLISLSLSTAPIVMWLDPPELVSVSYPEDPANPDWQPSSLIGGFTISHDIVYVHLPVRIEIPTVNWDKWEKRMFDLYAKAKANYSDTNVYALKRCKFLKSSPPKNNYQDYWNTLGNCGDAGEQYPYDSGGNRSDDKQDANMPNFMSSMTPSPSPYNTGAGRIHNLRRYRTNPQVWNSSTKYIFDLFDHWGYSGTSYVQGAESNDVVTRGENVVGSPDSPGPRDRSLRPKRKFIMSPDFGLGCLTCVISNGINLNSFMTCCIGKQLDRNEFWFMGKHEFRDFVYIDGIMGIGFRTPYHTCGDDDGGLGVYCVVIPKICLFWPLDSICFPSWKFGLPHWHLGTAVVKGEMLVNGRLYMADWIDIDGGTIYADDHIIKDETSAYDVTLHLDTLICWILTGFMGPAITINILGMSINLCNVVFAILNPIIAALVPWWPTLDLTNNSIMDFETYLDIDGIGPDKNVINPGTLYTRGDFRLMRPGWDAMSFLANTLLGYFLPFLELSPAMDPIRIWNGGAIVAGGRYVGGDPKYNYGNIFLDHHKRADILVYDPDNKTPSIGYAFARGSLSVAGDIVSQYGWGGLLDSCSPWAGNGLDARCAAAGIFYSGGIAAGTNPRNMYGRQPLSVGVGFNAHDETTSLQCLAEKDGLWEDPMGNLGCWGGALLNILKGDAVEHNIRGHVFAGQVGASPGTHFRLDQDASVAHDAVTRHYFNQLGGTPLNWSEIEPPKNLPGLVQM